MKKTIEFLNKYLFIFLFIVYLANKFLNTNVASQQIILMILVGLMLVNLFIKFYFLNKYDKELGTQKTKMGLSVLIIGVVILIGYAYFNGLIF